MDGQQSYALLQDALKSQEITQIVYEKIYGVDEAINSKKRVDPTKVVDNIGFTIDLIKESVRPMDKGLEKLFIVFFCIFKIVITNVLEGKTGGGGYCASILQVHEGNVRIY